MNDHVPASNPPETLRADLDKVPAAIASMFDHVARRYDLMNSVASLGQVHVWRRAVVDALRPAPGQKILDLAAGTGTSAAAIAREGAEVIACDLSAGMIEVGRQKHPDLEFVQGDATRLPFAADEFDAVTISFGLRNVVDVPAALQEMFRVTKPGGRLVICEFSTPVRPWFRRVYEWYLGTAMPLAAKTLSSDDVAYDYLVDSILDWPAQRELGEEVAAAGWTNVAYRNLAEGIVALHRAEKPRD